MDEKRSAAAPLNQQYPAIDWIKLIFAFTIVGIHTGGLAESGLIPQAFGVFSRLAVPGFFAISGFLFFRKPVTLERCLSYIKRCGILFLAFSLLFFVEFSLILGQAGPELFWLNTLKGGFRHLWFLYALIVGIGVLSVCDRIIKKKSLIYGLSGLLLLTGCAVNTYGSIIGVPASDLFKLGVVRGVLEAVPALAAGMVLARRQTPIARRISIPGTVLCFVLFAAECFAVVKYCHPYSTVCWLFTIPTVFFVLAFGTSITGWKPRPMIRKVTTMLYLVHPAFVIFLEDSDAGSAVKSVLIDPAGTQWAPLAMFFWVSMFSTAVVVCAYFASRTRYGKWLNTLM